MLTFSSLFEPIQVEVFTFIIFATLLYKYWSNAKENSVPPGYEIAKSSLRKEELIRTLKAQRKFGSTRPYYPNGWFGVLEADELKRQEIKEVPFMGRNVMVWRTNDDTPYVLDTCCNSILVTQEPGTNDISCTAHGWTFQMNDGFLEGNSDHENTSHIKVHTTLERNDFIYIWHHSENAAPTWFPEEVPGMGSTLKYLGKGENLVDVHIQDIMENSADINHFDDVHSDGVLLQYGGELAKKWLGSLDPTSFKWDSEWKLNKQEGKEHSSLITAILNMHIFGKRVQRVVQKLELEGPAIVKLTANHSFGLLVSVAAVIPVDEMSQKIVHRHYATNYVPQFLIKEIIKFARTALNQDAKIWNRKTYLSSPCLPKEDVSINRFRIWYSQFYTKRKDAPLSSIGL